MAIVLTNGKHYITTNQKGGISYEKLYINDNISGTLNSYPEAIFTADGRRVQSVQRGLNIIKMSDGRIVKVMKK